MSDEIDALLDADEETPPEPPSPQNPQPPVENVSLPRDLEQVWGVSPESRAMAASLVAEWGVEKFRSSALHTAALKNGEREAKMEAIRKAFIEARKKADKQK